MPPRNSAAEGFSMILPKRVQPPTHRVTNPQDGKDYYVRLTVQVRGRGYFDPFDYRFGKSVLANLDPSMLSFSIHISHHYCSFRMQIIIDTKRRCHQVKVNGRMRDFIPMMQEIM